MSSKFNSRIVFLIFVDLLILVSAMVAALVIRLAWEGAEYQLYENHGWIKIAFAAAVCLLLLYLFDLYDYEVIGDRRDMSLRLLQSLGIAWASLAVFYFFVPSTMIGRGTTLVAFLLILVLMLFFRSSALFVLGHPEIGEKVLIIGDPEVANNTAQIAVRRRDLGERVIGFVSENGTTVNGSNGSNGTGLRYFGGIDGIEEIVRSEHIDRLVIGMKERRGNIPSAPLLRLRLRGDVVIEEVATFVERHTGKITIDQLRPSWLIFSPKRKETLVKTRISELIQRSVALAGLLLSMPIALFTAVLIKLESRGPVFYTQERVGRNGRIFTLIKFRSMKQDAESAGQPVWASQNDERVTRVGRLIRKIRVDEIPQFWNILRGDMRFVGPRPERPAFVEELSEKIPFYEYRHLVKPGLTGWAQINFPYGSSVEDSREKLQYDLYYVKNQTILLDLSIMFSTFKIILLGRGGR